MMKTTQTMLVFLLFSYSQTGIKRSHLFYGNLLFKKEKAL